MEGLKIKFESDCLVKEKEVSTIALPVEGSIYLNNCLFDNGVNALPVCDPVLTSFLA